MAELQQQQQPEGSINGGGLLTGTSSENPPGPSLGSKRQRRPSVRLGDIGDQPATLSYESYMNKRQKQWNDSKLRLQQNPCKEIGGKSSKTRPLLNLGNGGVGGGGGGGGSVGGGGDETLDVEDKMNPSDGNLELAVMGGGGGGGGNNNGRRRKKRGGGVVGGGTKRVRSNWGSKKVNEEGREDNENENENDDENEKFSGGEDENDWYRDFDTVGSESPEQSPILAIDNMQEKEIGMKKRGVRSRVVDLEGPSDTDGREWKSGGGVNSDKNGGGRERERGGRCRSLEDGVLTWLSGLGLERYAPVFEIHEVDEEVLPILTLEDLKDMGINAVGSRRKLYCAIQKLAKGFS